MRPARIGAALATGLLVVLARPAVAQASSDYERGVAARLAGQLDFAMDSLARAAAAEPRNADVQLQYGLVLLAAGRLDESERAFRLTLELAPDYEDAHLALARVHQRRGDKEAALRSLAQVSQFNAEAAELRGILARRVDTAGDHRWFVDLDGSFSEVRAQQDWQDFSLRTAVAASPSTRIGAALESSRRFGEQDVYGEVRIDHKLAPAANVWVLVGGTPDADFRPRWQVAAGSAFKLTSGARATVATMEARHSRYGTGNIQMFNPGIEQYFAGGHWITARIINVFADGGHSSGWLARADVLTSDRLRLFGGLADAPDVTEGVVVRTFSLFGGFVFALNERTSWRVFANREDRQGGSDRIEIGTGIGLRF